jgi:DNA-binding winged helix-turn-helix (wHTH) protein
MYTYSESEYPLSFRCAEAQKLAEHIRHHRNVELVGMKRVGISNFLRFFLYSPRVFETYFGRNSSHILIPVDLLDLVEQEAHAFWLLTLKRIDDAAQISSIEAVIKNKVSHLFEKAMQSKDTFFTLDCIRSSLLILAQQNYFPTIFFIRFDRISTIITPEIFGNLQSLINAANHKLTYVFTSVRRLHNLKPEVFEKTAMSVFSHEIFLQPAIDTDSEIIFTTFKKKYNLTLGKKVHDAILDLCKGHVQYLQLSLIILNELRGQMRLDLKTVEQHISKDERILLQSEEILASLKNVEREALFQILAGKAVDAKLRQEGRYIWNVGIINENTKLFNPLFSDYVQRKVEKVTKNGEFFLTKKENILFTVLKKYEGGVCERDTILEIVWPEYTEIGVSDWAVDRLVARLRKKLNVMKSEYRIQTVKTRGFMMGKQTT